MFKFIHLSAAHFYLLINISQTEAKLWFKWLEVASHLKYMDNQWMVAMSHTKHVDEKYFLPKVIIK